MDKYTKYANVAPAITVTTIPLFLLIFVYMPIFDNIGLFINVLIKISLVVPIACIVGAIGFFFREVFRMTSKISFQYLIFKKDESKMPTTELLMFSNNTLTEQEKRQIREKIKLDFDIVLPSKEKEKKTPHEARKAVAHAVSLIREVTRDNPILLQYNYQYGFFRNAIGGCIIIIPLLLFLAILTQHYCWKDSILIWLPLGVQCLLLIIFIIMACISANDYARRLFIVYESTVIKR